MCISLYIWIHIKTSKGSTNHHTQKHTGGPSTSCNASMSKPHLDEPIRGNATHGTVCSVTAGPQPSPATTA